MYCSDVSIIDISVTMLESRNPCAGMLEGTYFNIQLSANIFSYICVLI